MDFDREHLARMQLHGDASNRSGITRRKNQVVRARLDAEKTEDAVSGSGRSGIAKMNLDTGNGTARIIKDESLECGEDRSLLLRNTLFRRRRALRIHGLLLGRDAAQQQKDANARQ